MELPFFSLLRLTSSERSRLLSRLDKGKGGRSGRERRERRRWEYRVQDLMATVTHPGGTQGRFLVCARNISTTGISFLHGGYLHPGSDLRIMMHRWNGRPLIVTGWVVHCRHVDGWVHEVGMRFTSEIELGHLFTPEQLEAISDHDEDGALPRLNGHVLFVDDAEVERRLFAHCIEPTGVQLTCVATPGAALDTLRLHKIDAVLCDLHLEDGDAVPLIADMRKIGYGGAIVVVTADDDVARQSAARAAGADEIIGKPYHLETLAMLLADCLEQDVEDGLIFSACAEQPGMGEMILDFVTRTRRLCAQLEYAINEQDEITARELCASLRGSGSGFGFEPVSVAARDAMRSLETADSFTDAIRALQRVVAVCRRMRCGNTL